MQPAEPRAPHNARVAALTGVAVSVSAVHDALPQTQCTRCGYPDCLGYAKAIVEEGIPINRCPPGGAEGIERLARITGLPVTALDPVHGLEAARSVVWIDEAWCIGCTLCLKVCPTDAIVGANKRMHTVIEAACTGCELCIPACPVDCIELELVSGERTGWQAWSPALAQQARSRYQAKEQRNAANEALSPLQQASPTLAGRKHDIIAAALAKAKMVQKSHKKE